MVCNPFKGQNTDSKFSWSKAKKKLRRFIKWRRILGLPIFLDCLEGEKCVRTESYNWKCLGKRQCCIYCDDEDCGFTTCGCIRARDAMLNYYFCEEDVLKEIEEGIAPWEL